MSTDRLSAYDQAVKLLARRAHFRREIVQKLAQRRYPHEEIDEALGRLEARRYLDDADASRRFVEGRLTRGGYGRARLAAELGARGVDDAVVREVLDELLPEDEMPAALEEARRWRRSGKTGPASLARRLERRGFSPPTIVEVLRREGVEDEGPA
jgi:regulatory protein